MIGVLAAFILLTPAALFVALISYLLGSIPFGIVITRMLGLGDLRQIGSGNIGATNVLRTGNKGAALATLLLDAGKGAIAVVLVRTAYGAGLELLQVAALFALLGHLFPIWLGFKGGKGVATCLGTLIALDWSIGLASCAAWLVVAALSRISSLAALVAVLLPPVAYLLVKGDGDMASLWVVIAALVWWRHRENIARLWAGTEPRIGKKD